MFTWDCPKCGHELDVDAEQCPKCGTSFKEELASAAPPAPASPPAVKPPALPRTAPAPPQAAPTGSASAARPPFTAPPQTPAQQASSAPPPQAPPAQAFSVPPTAAQTPSAVLPQTRLVPPARPAARRPFSRPPAQPAPAQPPPAQQAPAQASPPQVPLPEPAPPARARSPQPSPYGVQPKHLALILIVLVTAVVAALFFSRPSLFHGDSGLALEGVPEEAAGAMGAGSAVFGDLQVAGVRTWYTSDHKPKVRAVIINHGEVPRTGIDLQVHLRPAAAPADAPPLASFSIRLDDELGPQQIRDVETDLMALGTLASFPKWDQLRVDLEAR